jgi:hypothetical protein
MVIIPKKDPKTRPLPEASSAVEPLAGIKFKRRRCRVLVPLKKYQFQGKLGVITWPTSQPATYLKDTLSQQR